MAVIRLRNPDGVSINLNLRPGSLTAIEDNRTAFTFDEAGRLLSAFVDGRTYRRSLANDVLEKTSLPHPGPGRRLRRLLAPDEVERLENRACQFAADLAALLASHAADGVSPAERNQALEVLTRASAYSFARLAQERDTYRAIYGRVPIMPPDQYMALALQATEGCSFNACTFCGFYRDRRFRIKSPAEFRQHIAQVKAFLGRGLSLRRSIFLGDANALLLPQPALLDIFDALHQAFALPSAGAPQAADGHDRPAMKGVYSFIDAFSTGRKSSDDFAQLGARGLRRVYVGLETGDAELLKFLGKPNTPEDVARLVGRLKQAGLSVGVIVLIGAGGRRFARQHVANTITALNAMPLNAGDVVYLSELVDYPGSAYAQQAALAGIEGLSVEEIEEQMRVMREGVQRAGAGPLVSYYDVREFVY
ncbi:MAG: radical SAM protein [Anaerolineae bacterium]